MFHAPVALGSRIDTRGLIAGPVRRVSATSRLWSYTLRCAGWISACVEAQSGRAGRCVRYRALFESDGPSAYPCFLLVAFNVTLMATEGGRKIA